MTKREPKNKIQVPTRMARPKGDMFQNLRRPEEVESLSIEEIVSYSPGGASGETDERQQNPPQPTPSPTIPNHPQGASSPAPARDFNRRANSIERDALPSGIFPGSSKKLYDALYLRTRGAVQPRAQVRATKRHLMEWSGIRNVKTIETHIRYLIGVGLVVRSGENGDREGFAYEVRLPEQAEPPTPTNTIPNHPQPVETHPNQHQKTVVGGVQKTVLVGVGQTIDSSDSYASPKTFIKTNTDDDDERRVPRQLLDAEKEATGKHGSAEKWDEVFDLLASELRAAAGRTTVTSAPAFLAEHLRRRLSKTEPKQGEREAGARVEKRVPAAASKPELTPEQLQEQVNLVASLLREGNEVKKLEEQLSGNFRPEQWRMIRSMALAQAGATAAKGND